ncbi:MAG: hypothetical protein WCH43_04740, partial [Verrucomicrobiota bacterium]
PPPENFSSLLITNSNLHPFKNTVATTVCKDQVYDRRRRTLMQTGSFMPLTPVRHLFISERKLSARRNLWHITAIHGPYRY